MTSTPARLLGLPLLAALLALCVGCASGERTNRASFVASEAAAAATPVASPPALPPPAVASTPPAPNRPVTTAITPIPASAAPPTATARLAIPELIPQLSGAERLVLAEGTDRQRVLEGDALRRFLADYQMGIADEYQQIGYSTTGYLILNRNRCTVRYAELKDNPYPGVLIVAVNQKTTYRLRQFR